MAMPTPRNIKYVWAFGAILAYFLVVQLYSGIILAMHYAPNSAIAFESIEKLMRDTSYGWLMRYTHMVGASLFFFAAYIHMFRGLLFRLLQVAARGAVDDRCSDLPLHDGDGLHGLLAGLGPDELLGRDRHHQPVLVIRLNLSRPWAPPSWSGFGAGSRWAIRH